MVKKKRRVPPRFLVVARTAPGQWPVEVGVHPAGAKSLVSFSVGPHAVNSGGVVPLANVLDETRTGLSPLFAKEFDAAELHWLVPLLIRLHGGEEVKDEIVAAYRERHGKAPERMLWGPPRFPNGRGEVEPKWSHHDHIGLFTLTHLIANMSLTGSFGQWGTGLFEAGHRQNSGRNAPPDPRTSPARQRAHRNLTPSGDHAAHGPKIREMAARHRNPSRSRPPGGRPDHHPDRRLQLDYTRLAPVLGIERRPAVLH